MEKNISLEDKKKTLDEDIEKNKEKLRKLEEELTILREKTSQSEVLPNSVDGQEMDCSQSAQLGGADAASGANLTEQQMG